MKPSVSTMPTALAFLVGSGNLNADFAFTLAPPQAGFAGYILDGVPKVPTSLYTHVFFYVEATTFAVRRILIVDTQGNRNRFDLSQTKVNQPTTATFTWTPPAGVTVVSGP